VPSVYSEQAPRAQAQTKRQRSQKTPGISAKKSRAQVGKSFAQTAKERILIGVLDRGDSEGRIPENQWKWMGTSRATRCFEMLKKIPEPPQVFKDVSWYQRSVKVIACDDERSAELYKAVVSNVGEIYPGAKLEAMKWIPSSTKEPE